MSRSTSQRGSSTSPHRDSPPVSAGPSPSKEVLYGSPLAHGRRTRRSSSLTAHPEDLYNLDIRSSFHPQPIYLKVPNKDEPDLREPPGRRSLVDDSHSLSQGPPKEGQPTNKLALEALALQRQLDEEDHRNKASSQSAEKKEPHVAASAPTTIPAASPPLDSTRQDHETVPSWAPGDCGNSEASEALPVDTTVEQQTCHEPEDATDEAEAALSAIPPGSTQLRTPQSAQADESATAPYTDDATISRLLYSMTSKVAEGATMLSALTEEPTLEEEEEKLPSPPHDSVVGPLAAAESQEPQPQEKKAEPAEKDTSSSSFIVRAADSKSSSPEVRLSQHSSLPPTHDDAAATGTGEWEDWQSTSSRRHTSSASSASSRRGFKVLTGTSRTFGRTEPAEVQFGSPGGPPTTSASSSEKQAQPSVPAVSPPAAPAAAAAVAPLEASQPSNGRASFPTSSESDPHAEFFEDIDSMYSRSRERSSDSDKQKAVAETSAKEHGKSPSAAPVEPVEAEAEAPAESATEPPHTEGLTHTQALSSPQEEETETVVAATEASLSTAAQAELPIALALPTPEVVAAPGEASTAKKLTAAEEMPAREVKPLLPPRAEEESLPPPPPQQQQHEEVAVLEHASSRNSTSDSSEPHHSYGTRKSKTSEGRYIDLSGIESSPPQSASEYPHLTFSQMNDPLRLRAEEEQVSVREVPAIAHHFTNSIGEESPEPLPEEEEEGTVSQKGPPPVYHCGTSVDSSIEEHHLNVLSAALIETMEPPHSPKQLLELEHEVDKEEAQPLNEFSTFFPVSGSGGGARNSSRRGGRCSPPFKRKSPVRPSPRRPSPEVPWVVHKKVTSPPKRQEEPEEVEAQEPTPTSTPTPPPDAEMAEETPTMIKSGESQDRAKGGELLPDLSTLQISAITETTPSKSKISQPKAEDEEEDKEEKEKMVEEKQPRRRLSGSNADAASTGSSSSTHFTEERPSAAEANQVEAIEVVHNDMRESDNNKTENTNINTKTTDNEPDTEQEQEGEEEKGVKEVKKATEREEIHEDKEEEKKDEDEDEEEEEEQKLSKYSLSTIELLRERYRKQHAKVQEELLDVEREGRRILLEDFVKERRNLNMDEAVERGTIPCPPPPKPRGRGALLVSPQAPDSSSSASSRLSSAAHSPTQNGIAAPTRAKETEAVHPHEAARFLVADAQAAATAIAAQVSALLAEEGLARRYVEENEQEHLVSTRRLAKCMQDALDVDYLYAREAAAREAIGAEAQRSVARVREVETLSSVDRDVQQLRETVREMAVCIETENVVRVTVMEKEEKQRQEMQQLFQFGVAAQLRQEDARRRALTLETEEALEDLAYAEKHGRETLRIGEVRARARLYEEVGRLMDRERQLFLHQASQHTTISGSSLVLSDHHHLPVAEGSAPQFFEWAPTTNESSSSNSRKLQNSSLDTAAAHPPSPSLHLPSGTMLTSSNTTGNTHQTSSSSKDGGPRRPTSFSGSREQRSPTHIAGALSGGDTSVLLHALQQTQERLMQEMRQRTTPQNTETTQSHLQETGKKDDTTTLMKSPCRHLYSEDDRTLHTEDGEATRAEEPAAAQSASAVKKKKKVRINTAHDHVRSSQRQLPFTRHTIPCSLHNKPTLSSLMKKYAGPSDKEREEEEETARWRSPSSRSGSNGRQQKSPHRPYSDHELYNYDESEYLSSPTYIHSKGYTYSSEGEGEEEEEEGNEDSWSTQAIASPLMGRGALPRRSPPHTESEPSFSNVPREVFPQEPTELAGSRRASPTSSPPRVPHGCHGSSPVVEIVMEGSSPYRDITVSPSTVGRHSPSRSPSQGPRYAAPTEVSARHQCEVQFAHALSESARSSPSRPESPSRHRRGITCSSGVPKRFSSPTTATVITRVPLERGPGVWSAAPSPRNPFGLDGAGHRAMVAVKRQQQRQRQESALPEEHVLATTRPPQRAASARRAHPARTARPLVDPVEEENSRLRRELSSGGVGHLPESMRRGFAIPQHCALPEVPAPAGGRSKAVATYAPYDLCRTYTPKYAVSSPSRRANSARRQPAGATTAAPAPRKAPYSYVNTFYQANSKELKRKCDAVNQLGGGARVLIDYVPRTVADAPVDRNSIGDIHIVEDEEEGDSVADPFYPEQQQQPLPPPHRPLYPPMPSLLITSNASSTGLAAPKYLRGETGASSNSHRHSNSYSRTADLPPPPPPANAIIFNVQDEDEVVRFDNGDYYETNKCNQYAGQFWKERKDRLVKNSKIPTRFK